MEGWSKILTACVHDVRPFVFKHYFPVQHVLIQIDINTSVDVVKSYLVSEHSWLMGHNLSSELTFKDDTVLCIVCFFHFSLLHPFSL